MTALNFYSDPGHGWLEVPWTALKDLNLNPTDFSRYSYRTRNIFYLEEDCDAPKFIAAYEAKYGGKPTFIEIHQDPTFIRDLPPIY